MQGRPGSGTVKYHKGCETRVLQDHKQRRGTGKKEDSSPGLGGGMTTVFFTNSMNLLGGDNSGISTGCLTSAPQPPGR